MRFNGEASLSFVNQFLTAPLLPCSREGGMTWTPNIKTWEEIPKETHILTQAAGYFSMGILATMPRKWHRDQSQIPKFISVFPQF